MKVRKRKTPKEFVKQIRAGQFFLGTIKKIFASNASTKGLLKDLFLGVMTKKSLEKRYNIPCELAEYC